MMTRNEICKAMREELKEIRHKALSADRDAIRIKELQEQLAVSTRGQDCSRAASSAHTFLALAGRSSGVHTAGTGYPAEGAGGVLGCGRAIQGRCSSVLLLLHV